MQDRIPDRAAGGRLLAAELAGRTWHRPVVLGLPRGGVVVAAEVADSLAVTADVYVAGKLPAPHQPEYAIGALAEDGPAVWSAAADQLMPDADRREEVAARVAGELRRRVSVYRGGRSLPSLAGRDVICVDDGLATGLTARAAIAGLRTHRPRSIVLAVPVGAPASLDQLEQLVDEVISPHRPDRFDAVGAWYVDFTQLTDAQVRAALT